MPYLGSYSSVLLHHQPNYVNQYLTKTISETVTITEQTFSRLAAKIRTKTETDSIGESISRLAAKIRTRAETDSIGETLAKLIAKARGKTETDAISDGVIQVSGNNVVRVLGTETVLVSETRNRQANKWRQNP
jgi:predicted CopG family antitoxin